jgi:uncharacterized SAM-binding protein YcdF (DUF218 family)
MYDAILIPGGGCTDQGKLHPWVQARFDQALSHDAETAFYVPLSKGTTHKPSPYIESEVGKNYLRSKEICEGRILTETTSLDTIGNGFFARKDICDPQQLFNLLVITSQFHHPRTKAIFDWIFSLTPNQNYSLTHEPSPDNTMPPSLKKTRSQHETQQLQSLSSLIKSITTMDQLESWLFTHHNAYNGTPPAADTNSLAQSY